MTLSYIPSDTNDEGILKATASGVLPNGKPVVVNADGTVSVIVGSAASQGAEATFSATAIQKPSATFDTANNKVVVTYINSTNYIAVVVGTVSGTSISFGTPVIAESAPSEEPTVVFDPSNSKVVLTYCNNSPANGKSVVGTVSGTSISFGAKTTFKAGGVEYTNSVFDSNSNKVVAIWKDDNNSKAGTAIVGTVSGTSISFGSSTVFKASNPSLPVCAFDSTNNKIVIAYGFSNVLEAVVGTVSGTSITFGTPVSLGASGNNVKLAMNDSTGQGVVTVNIPAIALSVTVSGTSLSFGTGAQFSPTVKTVQNVIFDSSRNKFFIVYGVNIFPVTLSGTDVSFGSSSAFSAENISQVGATFDNNDQLVLAYRNLTDAQAGQSVVFTPASTTLTSENFIGISTGGTYASGSTATVKIIGNTSDEQPSLTAGQAYYVQTDGTIGTTAADPSVFAGTAVSATKLIVKG